MAHIFLIDLRHTEENEIFFIFILFFFLISASSLAWVRILSQVGESLLCVER